MPYRPVWIVHGSTSSSSSSSLEWTEAAKQASCQSFSIQLMMPCVVVWSGVAPFLASHRLMWQRRYVVVFVAIFVRSCVFAFIRFCFTSFNYRLYPISDHTDHHRTERRRNCHSNPYEARWYYLMTRQYCWLGCGDFDRPQFTMKVRASHRKLLNLLWLYRFGTFI